MSQDKQPHSTHQADSIMLTLVLILAAFGLLILFSACLLYTSDAADE